MRRKTDPFIERLPVRSSKYVKALGEGLSVQVYPSGERSFGRSLKNPAGHYQFKPFAPWRKPGSREGLTIEEAYAHVHELAAAALREPEATVSLKGARSADRLSATFYDLYEEFIEKDVKLRSIGKERKGNYAYALKAHFCNRPVPGLTVKWGAVRLHSFGGGEWPARYQEHLRALDQRATLGGDRRGPSTVAYHLNQFFHQLCDKGVTLGWLTASQIPKAPKGLNKPRAIDRALTVPQIEQLLKVTTASAVHGNDAINEIDAVYLRLLLMLGTRPNSMRLARRCDRNRHRRQWWTFPSNILDAQGARLGGLKKTTAQLEKPTDLHVPLTALVTSEIARLDEITDGSNWLFAERYAAAKDAHQIAPRSSSWAKHLIDEHAKLLGSVGELAYTTKALRATMSNRMKELGIAPSVVDACQARIPQGTAATYFGSETPDLVLDAYEQYHDFLYACMLGRGEDYLAEVHRERRGASRERHAARLKKLKIKPLKVA